MHIPRAPITATLVALTLSVLAPDAGAQDVRYTTLSKGEFGGALGRWMKLFGGSSETKETTSIKGGKLRTDTDEQSTVLDLDAGALTWMDHESKTYMTMTFAQAVERANAAMVQMEDSLEAAKADMEEAQAQQPENVRYEVRVSTDRTGKKTKIAGYDAEQVFLQVDVEAIPIRQPDETEEEANARAGTLVLLSELWLSTSFPGFAAKQAQAEKWAEALGGTETPSRETVQAYKFDPRIQEGFEKLAEEMKGIEGDALRSITHVVAVPHGVAFDRAAVLRDANKKLSDDVAGAAANEAKKAVSGIAGGLFGKKKEAEPPKPQQATIMRMRSEVTECSTVALSDDVFAVPAGYTERQF